MTTIEELEEKYSIEGEVGFSEMENDLIFVSVVNKYAEADICLYGAHVTRFRPYNTMDLLWMSPDSKFEEGSPIRGGIPVCFPWFGPHKTDPQKPQHGFGRLMYWNMLGASSLPNGETLIRMQLNSSDATKKYWTSDFSAEMQFVIGRTLNVTLKVTNTSAGIFDYTCALHSYFNLSSIENITIEGLHNARYHSQLRPGDFIQETPLLKVEEAETRHYYDTEATCIIDDGVFSRRIRIAKAGSQNTTVWNPWQEACAQIPDIPDDGYQSFVCIEAVNAFNGFIRLAPGETHETSAMIGLEE